MKWGEAVSLKVPSLSPTFAGFHWSALSSRRPTLSETRSALFVALPFTWSLPFPQVSRLASKGGAGAGKGGGPPKWACGTGLRQVLVGFQSL